MKKIMTRVVLFLLLFISMFHYLRLDSYAAYANVEITVKTVDDANESKVDVIFCQNGVYKNTTFYYKEIKSGRNYKLNTTIGSIDVTAANQKASPALIKVSDEPVLDDVTCKIIKKDKLSGLSVSESNSTLA